MRVEGDAEVADLLELPVELRARPHAVGGGRGRRFGPRTFRGVQPGEQDAARGRVRRGLARPDLPAVPVVRPSARPLDVQDVRVEQDAEMDRQARPRVQVLHERARDAADPVAPHDQRAELEDAQPQPVLEPVPLHPAELDEALQDPMGRRSGQARPPGYLGEREPPRTVEHSEQRRARSIIAAGACSACDEVMAPPPAPRSLDGRFCACGRICTMV
nr:hypothetical protein [Actinomadura sp. CNU-125]